MISVYPSYVHVQLEGFKQTIFLNAKGKSKVICTSCLLDSCFRFSNTINWVHCIIARKPDFIACHPVFPPSAISAFIFRFVESILAKLTNILASLLAEMAAMCIAWYVFSRQGPI